MAVDYFLKIDGIEASQRTTSTRVRSTWRAGAGAQTQSGTSSGGGGGGAGKVSMQDFHFVMRVNKASPKLMLACADGRAHQEATLTCRRRAASSRST
jgi:type VI secretion system secreted protein Hcp